VEPHFDGKTYDPALDHTRLTGQLKKIKDLMQDGAWWTYAQIQAHFPGMSTTSISARIRDLRKDKFGGYDVCGERIGGKGGTWRLPVPWEEEEARRAGADETR